MDFETTRWSLVLSAGEAGDGSRSALEQLCQTYWKPVFVYVRKRGYNEEQAGDLTQEFFLHLIEKNMIRHARQERGKFRHFMRASVRNFLSNEWDKNQAKKRGGGKTIVDLDGIAGVMDFAIAADDNDSPDAMFERAWALTLLDRAFARLREEWTLKGRGNLYAALECRLTGQELPRPYADLATEYSMTEAAVKLAAHRMRSRFRELLREEVLQTVASPEDLEQELKDLQDALAGNYR